MHYQIKIQFYIIRFQVFFMFPGVIALLVPSQDLRTARGRVNVCDIKLAGKPTRCFENKQTLQSATTRWGLEGTLRMIRGWCC